MFSKFDENAQKIIILAKKEMKELKHPYVGTEHLLLAILHNKTLEITNVLNEYKINYESFKNELIKIVGVGKIANEWFLLTPLLKRVLENAMLTKKDSNLKVTSEDLFISLLEEGEGVANRILMGMNIDVDFLYEKFLKKFKLKHSQSNNSLFLDEFGSCLNKVCLKENFDTVVGRDKEINRIMEILLRKTKNNPLLIGDAGVGKTAIIEELTRRIVLKNVPTKLLNMKIYSISMASLVAGTKYRGEFEERINKIIDEIEARDDIILFIDEIHTLVGAGGAEGAIDASNLIKPYLARGKIKVIGATTQKEYAKFIEKDKALDRRFQKIFITEPNLEQTVEILKHLKVSYENYHNVLITDDIILQIVNYSNRYMGFGRQPDKAIDILDEVCSKAALKDSKADKKIKNLNLLLNKIKEDKNQAIINHDYKLAISLKEKEQQLEDKFTELLISTSEEKKKCVSFEEVNEVIYEKTKIPIETLRKIDYVKIRRKLSKIIIGQEASIKKILDCLENCNLRYRNVPSSILLVGKSGVGKTFLVKEMAKELYNEDSFIRLDMSEYKEEHSISKIIGAPPGYIGFDNNDIILEKVKVRPYAIILLDEIEKANKNVLKLFLQVFDEGFMNTSSGEKIDFSNCTIFMTSNLGSNSNNIGFIENEKNNEELKKFLGVELLNRIDEIVAFENLSAKSIRKIILQKLKEKITIDLDKKLLTEIVDKIEKESNFREYGARKVDLLLNKYTKELMIKN